MGAALSLYLHLPFCRSRCTYCDFNAYAGLDELIPAYSRALAAEIRLVGGLTPYPHPLPPLLSGTFRRGGRGAAGGEGGEVHTLFFGGGTPSLTPLDDLALILAACRETFTLTPDVEITLEANPGTVSGTYLEGLRRLGVNRLSLGVQTAHQSELRLFDRVHTFAEAVDAVRLARAAGFDNLNLDLIYGVPGQTMSMWQRSLDETLALEPEHLSAYALSLEFGTPMQAWVQRGLLPQPDSDLAAEMYEWASDRLESLGYMQYEISNWAKARVDSPAPSDLRPLTSRFSGISPLTSQRSPPASDFRCRHNLQYWRNLPYLGFGAGAHGYACGWRYSVVRSPRGYIERIERGAALRRDVPVERLYGQSGDPAFRFSPAVAERHEVGRQAEMSETMMMGMRLIGEGVTERGFRARFGVGLADQYAKELRRLKKLGLVEWDAEGTRLTKPGRLVANRVFSAFL